MGKSGNAPHNGPSKTGNPSGGGRGNNPAWNDDDDDYAESVWPSERIDWSWKPTPEELRAQAERDEERKLIACAESIVRDQAELIRTTRDQTRQIKSLYPSDEPATVLKRIENIAMFLRSYSSEHTKAETAELRMRLRRTLTNHQDKLLDMRLATPPGPFSQSIMRLVTIDDWLRHFSDVLEA